MLSPGDIDIRCLLPQQPPFVAVGRLLSCGQADAVSETRVSEMPLFVEGDHLTPAGLIENMAQTCAAWTGYEDYVAGNTQPKVGFIGAVRDCEIHSLPRVSDTLTTSVLLEQEVFGMMLVTAQIKVADVTVANATLKIALQK